MCALILEGVCWFSLDVKNNLAVCPDNTCSFSKRVDLPNDSSCNHFNIVFFSSSGFLNFMLYTLGKKLSCLLYLYLSKSLTELTFLGQKERVPSEGKMV